MIKEAIRNTEDTFENSGYWIHDHPKRVILMMLLVVVFLAFHLPSIQFYTSNESFFEKDDPTLLEYDAFREQFGRDEIVLALIHPKDVFDITFLEKLKAFHQELEETVPHLDEVRSLVNVTSMRGEEGELIIEELMEDWPETEEEIAQLRKRVLDNKFYRNFLVSEDGLYTAVMIRSNAFAESIQEEALDAMLEGGFEEEEQPSGTSASESLEEPLQRLSDEQNTEFVGAIKQVAANHRTLDFPIDLGGSPVMVSDLKQKMFEEMPKFVISSILMIAFLLSLLFRRISGVILPLLTVVLSLFSTIGLFSLTSTKLTIISQILPSFLLAVGVGYSVHLLVIFYRHLRDQGNKREAIGYALGHSGLAILITSLTTAGGLLSFSPVKVAPVSDLGIFGAAGVLICVSFTLILLPALLALIPFSSDSKKKTPNQKNPADRILKSCGDFAVSRPWFVIAVSLGIALISSIGAAQLRFSHDPIKWLPDGHSLRSANQVINDHMKGSANLELVVRRAGENAVKDPEFMNRLEEFNQFAETQTYKDILIGKSSSIVDTVKEINQVLKEDQEEYYQVPQDRELIAQELLLFENGVTDDLENLVDTPFSQSR
ncbi:MAG: MMPL family transporter, partial [SAR324 cluster bacterium]|nr:MMPL family transporter [SAR324 cluster bacterium]